MSPMHIVYGLVFDEHDERVLMVQNDRGRGWSLPGGGQERGESLAETARREVFEETGYDTEPYKLVAISERLGACDATFFVFACRLLEPEPVGRPDDAEIHEVAWMEVDRADELMPWYPVSVAEMRRRFEASYFVDREAVSSDEREDGEHFSVSIAPMSLTHGAITLHLITEQSVAELEEYLRDNRDSQTFIDAVRAHYLPRYDAEGRRTKWGFYAVNDGEVVGCSLLGIGSWPVRRGYTGAFTLPEMRGRGIAPGSKPHLFYLGFELLGLHRIETGCNASNLASKRSIEKTPGFRFEGTLRGYARGDDGEFEDEHRYAIVREDWKALYEPAEIVED
ncbi:GNAT family N-acetyltransferase [Persicimonas caeni]|nr:GNAT family N-acetyltransferase [Persicimonas caeni]